MTPNRYHPRPSCVSRRRAGKLPRLLQKGLLWSGLLLAGHGTMQAEEISAASPPLGALSDSLSVGLTGMSFPLLEAEVLQGVLSGNSGAVFTFSTPGTNVGSLLSAGQPYYLEILNGPFEGERFDVATAATVFSGNATVTVGVGASTFSTRGLPPAGSLAQARCAIRPHLTLGRLGSLFTPALSGNNNFNLADGIRIHGTQGFVFYHLRSDGESWRTPGNSSDQRNRVIPPDASFLVELRSGGRNIRVSGQVRTTVFRKTLLAGIQSFATGYPIAMTPAQLGAWVDTLAPAGARWQGSDNPQQADTFSIFNRATGTYVTYHLRADGLTWQGDGTLHIDPQDLVLVRRANSDPDYLILPSFDL